MPLPEDIPSAELVTPKKEPFFYGGQAVIEGVMMRGKRYYAVAVRVPTTKEIVIDRGELKASIYTSRFWKLPFVRGIALIGEQMHLGMRSLMWSANMNAGSRDIQISKREITGSVAVALVFALALFIGLPLLLADERDAAHERQLPEPARVDRRLRLTAVDDYPFGSGHAHGDCVIALAAHHHALDDRLTPVEERLFLGGYQLRRGDVLRERHLSGLGGPLAEALDLSARVNDELCPCEEGVAHRADFGLELFASRARRERVSAHASDERVFVVSRVNSCFHGLAPWEVY